MSYGVNTVKVQKGLYLDRRANSPYWYGRLSLQKGVRYRFSTQTDNLEQAKLAALRHVIALEERVRNNLPINTRTFRSVAEAAKLEMDQHKADGIGKRVYDDYKEVIDNYLIPFFGQMHISTITQATLQQFDIWRIQKMQRHPAHSTLNTHNAAFNRVLDYAEKFGWVTNATRPEPINDGRKSESRGAFTNDEYKHIVRMMRYWPKAQVKEHPNVTFAREVLRNYILILANTGIRHGTEALELKWKNINWFNNGVDSAFLQVSVDGKTGKRTLIARDRTIVYFDRHRNLYPHLRGPDIFEFLKQKSEEYVFADRKGKPITAHAINQNFNEFLAHHNLKMGADGKTRTPYSFRHYYITRALLRGIPIHDIALQVGTSSKMIEAFYSKVSPQLQAKLHSGRAYYGGGGSGNTAKTKVANASLSSGSVIDDVSANAEGQPAPKEVKGVATSSSIAVSMQKPEYNEIELAVNLLISGKIQEAGFLKMMGIALQSGAMDSQLRSLLYRALGEGKLSEAGLLQIIR